MTELERAVAEFRNLNRRRLYGSPPLEVAELERWSELREALGAAFEKNERPEADQRDHLRLPTHLRVVFESGEDLREAFLGNISEGGIFIVTQRPLAEGAPVRLRIVADALAPLEVSDRGADALAPFEVSGRVAWVRAAGEGGTEPGMGIRFEAVDDTARERLDQILSWVSRTL